MGATFSRIKNWTTEVLSNTDLNAEIDNILTNLGPAGIDDYSTNSTTMRIQTSPGAVGSESLPTSLAGELERLRYVIQRMIGSSTTYWYEAPPSTFTDLVNALGTGLPSYRIVSGRTTGNSSQLCALIPSGVSASVTLSASVTPLVYYIGGTQYSITANVTLNGLSLAPTSNTTCMLNSTAAAAQQWTRLLGQYGTSLNISGAGTNVATLVGNIAGFKTGTEYFLAYATSTASLTNALRGAMFNQSANNVTAVGVTGSDVIKAMRLAWIFANTNSSLAVTYNNPTVSAAQPTSPTTGDYWFDLSSTAWKTFNSTTWVAANALLIGVTMQDTVACVAARTLDSYIAVNSLNSMDLSYVSNTQVQAAGQFSDVNIFGTTNRFSISRPIWDVTTNLESGLTESANSTYYFYMKENGTPIVSDKAPLNRRDLQGLYHPAETWRCLGDVNNNNSTNFENPVRTFRGTSSPVTLMGSPEAYDTVYNNSKTTALSLPSILPDHFTQAAILTPATWASSAIQWGDAQTLSLAPGLWRLEGNLGMMSAGATACQVDCGISTITGNSFTDSQVGVNFINSYKPAVATQSFPFQTPPLWARVTATQTYYLKMRVFDLAGGTTLAYASVQGTRIDSLLGMPK